MSQLEPGARKIKTRGEGIQTSRKWVEESTIILGGMIFLGRNNSKIGLKDKAKVQKWEVVGIIFPPTVDACETRSYSEVMLISMSAQMLKEMELRNE